MSAATFVNGLTVVVDGFDESLIDKTFTAGDTAAVEDSGKVSTMIEIIVGGDSSFTAVSDCDFVEAVSVTGKGSTMIAITAGGGGESLTSEE